MKATDDKVLERLRDSLLSGRRQFGPADGVEAFEAHKLLASIVHRTTRLDRLGSDRSDTAAWVRYFAHFFPSGRNGETDARLLFSDWRTSLLKDNTPGPGVAIAHGHPSHWTRDASGALLINLEDMWDDYASSVEKFVAYLRTNHVRRKVVLQRASQRTVEVRPFVPVEEPGLAYVASVGSSYIGATISATAWGGPMPSSGR